MFGNILHPLPRKYVREDLRLQHRKQESFYLAGYGLLRTVFYNPIFDSSNAENAVVSSFSAFLMIKKCSYILLLFLCASNNLFHVNIGCNLMIRTESKSFMQSIRNICPCVGWCVTKFFSRA